MSSVNEAVRTVGPPPPPLVDRDNFMLAYLAQHEAQCPACGYNVHALTSPRCPECGRGLTLRVVGAVGFNKVWICLLIPLAIAAGIGLLVAVVLTHESMPSELSLKIVLEYFLANIPLPVLALFLRRPFGRLPKLLQRLMAMAALCSTAVMLVWFLAKIIRNR